jgi:predicted GNAT family N-acyltransferase
MPTQKPPLEMKKSVILIQPWHEVADQARLIREAVFIQEQGVPIAMEWDEHDPTASHALAFHRKQCVGTGRLIDIDQSHCQIGRMSVLKSYRRQGIGGQLFCALLAHGKERGFTGFHLHAQLAALPFYQKWGFVAEGEIYLEAGLPHRNMILLR